VKGSTNDLSFPHLCEGSFAEAGIQTHGYPPSRARYCLTTCSWTQRIGKAMRALYNCGFVARELSSSPKEAAIFTNLEHMGGNASRIFVDGHLGEIS
jgi:hypothetical protein